MYIYYNNYCICQVNGVVWYTFSLLCVWQCVCTLTFKSSIANDAAATWRMLIKLSCASWLRHASVRTRTSAIAEGARNAFCSDNGLADICTLWALSSFLLSFHPSVCVHSVQSSTVNEAAVTWWMLIKLSCASWLRRTSVRTRTSAINSNNKSSK